MSLVVHHSKIERRCPRWVISGKPHTEHFTSAITPTADMRWDADCCLPRETRVTPGETHHPAAVAAARGSSERPQCPFTTAAPAQCDGAEIPRPPRPARERFLVRAL